MSKLVRLSLSIEKPLLDRLEKMVRRSGYTNRSEFVRDMVRRQIVEEQWRSDREALGTVTLIYDHHQRRLSEKLTGLQHHYHNMVLVTTHVHLDEHLCAEVLIVKARAGKIREIADLLRQQKGVLHAALSLSSIGKELA